MKAKIKKIARHVIPSAMIEQYKKIKRERQSKEQQTHFHTVMDELVRTKNEKRLLLIGTAVSGNLGDQAISIAEMTFLQEQFPGTKLIEIQQTLFNKATDDIKQLITDEDILLINGGGFLGTLWPIAEEMARDIIQSFPKNRVVIFPQTIFFEESEKGREELTHSIRIFQSHPDLTIFVRDQASYEFAQKHYLGGKLSDIFLVPDIVTYLDYSKEDTKRDKIVFCLRRDKEKLNHNDLLSRIETYLKEHAPQYSVIYTDSVIEEELDMFDRQAGLDELINEFSEAKLVVTDRLHGMVLSAISSTPCLAMNNISGKVKGAYGWLSYLDYLAYADDVTDVDKKIEHLLSLEETKYKNNNLIEHHELIKQSIMKD